MNPWENHDFFQQFLQLYMYRKGSLVGILFATSKDGYILMQMVYSRTNIMNHLYVKKTHLKKIGC